MATIDKRRARLLAAALAYPKLGWRVFPVHSWDATRCSCGKLRCESPAKHPRTKHGLKEATTDEKTIRAWWKKWPDANIGIATGTGSGIFVIDVDSRAGGHESIAELERRHGKLPATVESVTGSLGRHIVFAHPKGGVHIRTIVGLALGIDVRGDGGYIVAPPSNHASGREYTWELSSRPDEMTPAAAPDWLITATRADIAPHGRKDDGAEETGPISEGQRNATLTSLAGTMRARGMTKKAITAALVAENVSRCSPPLPEREVQTIAASVSRYPAKKPQRSADADQFHTTDVGNGHRLAIRHGRDLRYCHAWKAWFVWNGRHWARDETGEIVRRAKETIRALLSAAYEKVNADREEELVKHAIDSEKAERIRATITLAQSEMHIPVVPEELDADPWRFNCQNGTLDLRTGELRPHAREDLITLISPVAYDPSATLDLWDRFLEQSTGGDTALLGFLQRAAGYSLTGLTSEEVLFMVLGPGATGKSTFLEAIKSALGDYARTADFEAFLKRRESGGPRNDIARLAGARLVASIEVDEGKRLAEGLVKMITGGDKVSARFLYQESFEFDPAFKLWLAANHAPVVRDDDDALWRRILRVPFEHVVPKDERDPSVKARLKDPTIGGPAILAWLVRGCLAWQRDGLGVPPAVESATAAYREDMDPIADFLADRCEVDSGATVRAEELQKTYQEWARAVGVGRPLGPKRFAAQLEGHGFERARDKRGRFWVGLRVAREGA
jgi:putative DNA primase/helicase